MTRRSVRDHLVVLQKKYKKKMRQEEQASGISPEQTELDSLIEDINEVEEAADVEHQEASRMQQEKVDKDKEKAEDIRQTAMETLAETKKRKGENKENKPKRRSGVDTVEYLREKFHHEQKIRQDEMEIKQKVHELEEKKYHANLTIQQETSKQQMEMLQVMKEQNHLQQAQQQQQFQQHIKQMSNFQMMLMQSQQEQQKAMLEFFSKVLNKN